MKVLLFGANGWLGSIYSNALTEAGHAVIHATSRASDPASVLAELRQVEPTHVLACIGRTHGTIDGTVINNIDYLEYPGKLVENIRDNLFSPVVLAHLTRDLGIHFTYLGTGCIYDYDDAHPVGSVTTGYGEHDAPNYFGSGYSVVKGFTGQLMELYSSTVLHWRIRMPITDDLHPRNFVTKILRYPKVCSMPNSMTVFPTLMPTMIRMMEENVCGTFNMTNPGVISHNEILEMYRDIVDPTYTWTNFTIDEQNEILKSRRSNNCLDTSKLVEYDPTVLSIHEAVRYAIRNMV
jgi:3,5-epimerase/4-reductase